MDEGRLSKRAWKAEDGGRRRRGRKTQTRSGKGRYEQPRVEDNRRRQREMENINNESRRSNQATWTPPRKGTTRRRIITAATQPSMDKQKLNDNLNWQCIFDTNPSPIVIQIRVVLPACKTHSYVKLQHRKCCIFYENNKFSIIFLLLMKTPVIRRGHQVGVKGYFSYRFKGTIN